MFPGYVRTYSKSTTGSTAEAQKEVKGKLNVDIPGDNKAPNTAQEIMSGDEKTAVESSKDAHLTDPPVMQSQTTASSKIDEEYESHVEYQAYDEYEGTTGPIFASRAEHKEWEANRK